MMGCFDDVRVPCPRCGEIYYAQSKGGPCLLDAYDLDTAPADVLSDVNRHAPFECPKCGTVFRVKLSTRAEVVAEPTAGEALRGAKEGG